jgi:ATP/maltotriose-dependent transcriptional regulator MalT
METGHTVRMADFVKRETGERQLATQKTSKPGWWSGANPSADYRLIEPLTDRELRFLGCLADGVSNKELARSLCVSENTVKFHLKNVYSKFAVRTRLQAIRAAYELGVLTPQDQQRSTLTGTLS